MFSLIISIISIALVAALAAATVYFGGAAFNKGSDGALASTFINSAQQISGGFTLASADGYDISGKTVENLTTAEGIATGSPVYLAQVPSYKNVPLTLLSTNLLVTSVSKSVCEEINKRAKGTVFNDTGVATLPTTDLYGCAKTTAAITSGSQTVAANSYAAYYKVK